MPKVLFRESFRARLAPEACTTLRDEFLDWKAGGEYAHYTFGKDAGFSRPKLAVDESLRHVHMVPLQDLDGLEEWERAFHHRGRKTSNRVLVYTCGLLDSECYLLIDLFDEPDGHSLMEDDKLIEELAEVAGRFRDKF
ncbi:type II toxin-antitoxin system YafO family toxin [Halomonas sp. JS92-SW72]|uniref:type II toxin-antitoxin system YafO family toxin n=1 Tax=Halomonas sp. JS92-SW72 TaxID=2306583 RepID=UPI000E5B974C|nr:type II toxin-antitoxin system YafO family toxin [Halomonas sp. JS92-SW72]AXY42498.1 hypothetical protein D1793_09930 [Halomonas sp. JS92-SW72]